jgi:hypothetical protein
VPRITDFCICIYVFGSRLSLFRLCDSDCGITPVNIFNVFCFHIAHIALGSYCFGEIMCTRDSYVYWGQLCVLGTAMCTGDSYVYWGQLCVLGTAMSIGDSYV